MNTILEHYGRRLHLTLALSALVAVPGAIALVSTDPAAPGTRLVDGSYQRIYEDRFEEQLPGRDFALHAWNAFGFFVLGDVPEGAVLGADGWLFTAEEFEAPAITRNIWQELEHAREALSKRGAILLPVIVPDKARIMDAMLPLERSDRFRSRYDILLSGLGDHGFAAIDLRPVLGEGPMGTMRDATGETFPFMKTDTHWSPSGAARAAQAIASHVAPLDLPRTAFLVERTGSRDFQGDLLNFVKLGPFLAHADDLRESIDEFEVTQAGNAAEAGLFGDIEVPVALVGTSYSARSEFNFEGFLKSELGADLVNYSEVGLGPFEPMDRYLSSLEERPSSERLVIWEIPERYVRTWRAD